MDRTDGLLGDGRGGLSVVSLTNRIKVSPIACKMYVRVYEMRFSYPYLRVNTLLPP